MVKNIIRLLFLVMVSCSNNTEEKPVAMVNSSKLTIAELEKKHVPLEEYSSAINSWIDEEVLYQNALNNGVGKKSQFFADFERRMLGNAFLLSVAGKNISIENNDIHNYYEKNKSQFVRHRKGARVYHFFYEEKTSADSARKRLVMDIQSNQTTFIRANKQFPVVVYEGEQIPEIDRVLFSTAAGKQTIIGPVQSTSGFHLFWVLNRVKENAPLPVESVYEEIYQRLYQQKLSFNSLRIMDSLRTNTTHIIVE